MDEQRRLGARRARAGQRLQAEHFGQRQTTEGKRADLQKRAAAKAVLVVGEMIDGEHGVSLDWLSGMRDMDQELFMQSHRVESRCVLSVLLLFAGQINASSSSTSFPK